MSNVILGIIGVVLFIGLAVASAVWIGPEFMTASADTQATRLASSLQQVVFAMRAYKVKEGAAYPSSSPYGLIPTYLKSRPVSLDGTSAGFNQYDLNGYVAAPGSYVVTDIYGSDQVRATAVCRSLAGYAGETLPTSGAPVISSLSQLTTPTGCFSLSAAAGNLVANNVYAYGRL